MTRGITGGVTLPSISVEPALPRAVGPLSATVLDALRRGRPALHARPIDVPVSDADPYGLDLQLALYACYELGMQRRWLCSGDCNIRVDLVLFYPVLLALSLASVAAAMRARRPGSDGHGHGAP